MRATPSPLSALNPAMRLFVERYAELTQADGDSPKAAKEAATYAGYSASCDQAAYNTGRRLLAREDVKEALVWLIKNRMTLFAPRALELLMSIAEGKGDGESFNPPPWQVRYSAIRDVLDRTGFGAKQQIDVNHTHSYDSESIAQVKQSILADLQLLGNDAPAEMRALLPHIMDAEFQEVADTDQLEATLKAWPTMSKEEMQAREEEEIREANKDAFAIEKEEWE